MVAYLGIDVSKGYADLCLLSPDKELLEDIIRLDDTRKGHDCPDGMTYSEHLLNPSFGRQWTSSRIP